MLTDEVAAVLARFFDHGQGPSHDELTRFFTRAGLGDADPNPTGQSDRGGKMKRVRAVLGHAIDFNPDAGTRLVKMLMDALRSEGAFRTGSEDFAGADAIAALRLAFNAAGWELDPEGTLRPRVLDNLEGTELTAALWAYVRRARAGEADAALQVGTAKDLLEAVARHLLQEHTGSYSSTTNFPVTIFQLFDRLGLAASFDGLNLLDRDPHRAVQQAAYIFANAINRLRNAEGTGHGRPTGVALTASETRLVVETIGVLSGYLLRASEERRPVTT